jgi:hypothetical protein
MRNREGMVNKHLTEAERQNTFARNNRAFGRRSGCSLLRKCPAHGRRAGAHSLLRHSGLEHHSGNHISEAAPDCITDHRACPWPGRSCDNTWWENTHSDSTECRRHAHAPCRLGLGMRIAAGSGKPLGRDSRNCLFVLYVRKSDRGLHRPSAIRGENAAPTWAELKRLSPWLVLAAAGFMIPVMWGLLWGSKHIDAGRLGILLQMEAVVGIGSAALLTDEPFGIVELTGTLLVVGAGVVDVLGDRPKRAVV